MEIISRTVLILLSIWIISPILVLFNLIRPSKPYTSKIQPIHLSNHTTTIVTAYYLFKKSKHSPNEYEQWLTNFLAYVDNPMVIFTSEKEYPFIYQLRNKYTNKNVSTVFILNYSSPFEMAPIKKLENIFKQQFDHDPEKSIHSIDLYAIWCAKSYMLNLTTVINPFRSKYFLWVDAGSFRTSKYRFKNWPDPSKVSQIFSNDSRFLLGLINPLRKNSCHFHNNNNHTCSKHRYDLIQGTFFGGSSSSIHWWTNLFFKTIDDFIAVNEFIGKDQYMMNFIALCYPGQINVILAYKTFCDDIWFAYGPLLANNTERRLLFGDSCQANNLTTLVRPLNEICSELL